MQAIRDVTLPPLPFYSLRRVYTSLWTNGGRGTTNFAGSDAMRRGERGNSCHVTQTA